VLVDRVLQRAHSVDQALDLVAVDLRTIGDRRDPVGVALQPRRGVRSALAAVGVQAEPPVVREEVRVGLDVGYHRLLVGGRVRLLEKRVARIVVVDDLERLPEPVAIQLRLPLVVHSPPPVGVPPLEAAVRDQFVHLVVVDDPVPHRVRLQPEPFGERARFRRRYSERLRLAFRFDSLVPHRRSPPSVSPLAASPAVAAPSPSASVLRIS